MGWLDKIMGGKLVDMKVKLKAGQMGILNIRTEKKTYNTNLTFATPESAKAFAETVVAANQTKIPEIAEQMLAANSAALEALPESKAVQAANEAIVESAAAASGVKGKVKAFEIQIAETVAVGGSLTVKPSSEGESDK